MAALPQRPQSWRLIPGVDLLKGLIRDIVPDSQRNNGVTTEELDIAADDAWEYLMATLISLYDVSTFGTRPPIPLKQVWKHLAAAHVRRIVTAKYNVASSDEDPATKSIAAMEKKAKDMLAQILDSDIKLVNPYTLAIVRARTNARTPVAYNPRGYEVFSVDKTDQAGYADMGSIKRMMQEVSDRDSTETPQTEIDVTASSEL